MLETIEIPALVRVTGLWFLFAFVAFFNGAMRETTYGRSLSKANAETVGGVIVGGFVLVVSVAFFRMVNPPMTFGASILTGFYWFGLTILFEMTIARVLNRPIPTLGAFLHPKSGSAMPFVLYTLLLVLPVTYILTALLGTLVS